MCCLFFLLNCTKKMHSNIISLFYQVYVVWQDLIIIIIKRYYVADAVANVEVRMRLPACRSSWTRWQDGVSRCPRPNMWARNTQIWPGNQSPHPGASIALVRLFCGDWWQPWWLSWLRKDSNCSLLAFVLSCCQLSFHRNKFGWVNSILLKPLLSRFL